MDLEFQEVVEAYYSCRRGKRNSVYALDFEFHLEENLFALYTEIKEKKYKISRSIAFVIEQPKIREIWSATFRDRIVHHIIFNRLVDRFQPRFIRDSFACIRHRGTLDGSNRLFSGMRSITSNWQKDGYFLGADVRNFFVSIHKPTLFKIVEPRVVEPWLLDLIYQVIFHDPRENCLMKSKPEAFGRVPKHKSLWETSSDRGLPIGNLTSQFFANVYMNELDQYAKHILRARYYYRYVDDIVILDPSSDRLNRWLDCLQEYLMDRLKLEFHPFKKRIGLIHQGIDFVGYVHKPSRRYIRTRTLNKMKSRVSQWRKRSDLFDEDVLDELRSSMNSYLGIAKWGASYKIRRKIMEKIDCLFVAGDQNCSKIVLNRSRTALKKL
ncbi:MAG: RNA-directed DNA polymerase [Bdellovibrionales bacterium]|nr:RNA-directed DNA polymerase [Bdellovibrionales bacterium]